jgi:hypothetical protein
MSDVTSPVLRFDADRAVLAALLELAGDSASPTPLSAGLALDAPGPLSRSELDRLTELEVLTRPRANRAAISPAFRAAAAILLGPATLVTVRLRSPVADLHATLRFPRSVARGSGVSLTPFDGRCRVASPISGEDVLGLLDAGFLSFAPAVEPRSFRALLDPAVAATLFGILDWARLGGGATAREAGGPAAIRVGPDDVRPVLGWKHLYARADCFIPYLTLALGAGAAPDKSEIESAFRRLGAAGLLTPETGRYRLAGGLLDLAHPAACIAGALHWHQLDAHGSEANLKSRVVLALGAPPRLLLAIDATEGGVLLTAPGSSESKGDFERAAREESPAGVKRNLRFCPQCRATLRPGVRFCSQCRSPL